MVNVLGFEIPEDLYYDVKNHIWVKLLEDGTVKVGLDDVGQALAKRILFIRFKKEGAKVVKGKALGVLESAKWVGPIVSPISGTIIKINEQLKKKPSLVNDDPYGEGWIAIIKLANLQEDLKDLVTGEEAVKLQEEEIKEKEASKE